MTDTMFDAGKNARRETNAIKGWIDEKLPFWDEVIDVNENTGEIQVSRFPGMWTTVFNRIMPAVGGHVLVIRANDGIVVMGPPPEEFTHVQVAPEDPDDAEPGQIYKVYTDENEGYYYLVTAVYSGGETVYQKLGGGGVRFDANHLFSFGDSGLDDGEFTDLRDVAVNQQGYIFVAADGRIQTFNGSGVYQNDVDSSTYPFVSPNSVFFSKHGDLRVTDAGQDAMLWGGRQYPSGVSIRFQGSFFGGLPPLSNPSSVISLSVNGPDTGETISSTRFVIADTDNNMIRTYLLVMGGDSDQEIEIDGGIEGPTGMSVLGHTVWICEPSMNRVRCFTYYGEGVHPAYLVENYQITVAGGSSLSNPTDTAVDAYGNLFVADSGNNRIVVYSLLGEYKGDFGSAGSVVGRFSNPVSVDSVLDKIYVGDAGNNRVQVFSNPSAPSSEDIPLWNASYLSKFGLEGGGNGQFRDGIRGIAVRPDTGDVYVSSGTGARSKVQKFSANGTYLSTIATYGTGGGQVDTPWGLDFDGIIALQIADSGNNRILIFDTSDIFSGVHEGGLSGTLRGMTSNPDRGRKIFGILDDQFWTPHMLGITLYGDSGSALGEFNKPHGIAAGRQSVSADRILIADTGNHRIQALDSQYDLSTAAFVYAIGAFGSGRGQFNTPDSIAIDSQGNIYVTDSGNHRVQVFDSAGIFRGQFGKFGTGDGEFNTPTGIAITDEYIYICDSGNNRVQIFANPVAPVLGEVISVSKAATTGLTNTSTVTYVTAVNIDTHTDFGTTPDPLILPAGTWEVIAEYNQTYFPTSVATWGIWGRFNGTPGPTTAQMVANTGGSRASMLALYTGKYVSNGLSVFSIRFEFVRHSSWAATPSTEPGYMTVTFRRSE